MEATNTLNGFQAVFDTLIPNVGKQDNINIDDATEELTEEELEAIKKQSKTGEETEEPEEEETVTEPEPKKKPNKIMILTVKMMILILGLAVILMIVAAMNQKR